MKILDNVNYPKDLTNLSYKDLNTLSQEIRDFLIEEISKIGGHLSSNLGVVELTIALHRKFNLPKDKMFFDCGHQSYVHKILTGRKDKIKTIGNINGIIGFQDLNESEYDQFSTGHTSNSISAAMGLAVARTEPYHIVPVIGDGALTGGLALEALINISHSKDKIIIVLNDNGMSISSNKTAVSKFRTSGKYRLIKNTSKASRKIPLVGNVLYSGAKLTRNVIKKATIGNNFFESMGIKYLGVYDGHDIKALEKAFDQAKKYNESVIVHVLTQKGKGYKKAEDDTSGNYHGVGKFDSSLGLVSTVDARMKSWSKVISSHIETLMKTDQGIRIITPAMLNGSCLNELQKDNPTKVFDVGIAEQHAISLASGMALGGLKPFVSIYSSFLQRGYDQLVHDVARLNLHVVIGVDRAGLSGTSGATHHGLFDIPMIRSIPNFVMCQPRNSEQAYNMLKLGFGHKGPFAIRYPKGAVTFNEPKSKPIKIGSWEYIREIKENKFNLITLGEAGDVFNEIFDEQEIPGNIIDGRFIKPIDIELLKKLIDEDKPLYVFEHNNESNGIGSIIRENLFELKFKNEYKIFSFPDEFIAHGADSDLYEKHNISIKQVTKEIKDMIK